MRNGSLILRRDPGDVISAVGGRASRERLVVVHLHGSIDAPLDIILDSLSYSELGGLDAFRKSLTLLLNNFTLVFMGTRLDEQLIANELLLNRIGRNDLGRLFPRLGGWASRTRLIR